MEEVTDTGAAAVAEADEASLAEVPEPEDIAPDMEDADDGAAFYGAAA